MVNISKDGISTGFIKRFPSRKELEKLSVDKLLLIARRKIKFKQCLLDFLEGIDTDKI